jgi:hypothetical protein
MDPAGPLFATPVGGHGVPWLHVLPILAAVPAAALLLWGLVRGLPLPALGGAAVLLSLAAIHYQRGAVSRVEACYTCHSGYGIWGTFAAKKAGMRHMIHTLTGGYELPLALNGPFDIDSCLGCHLGASRFRAVEMHQSPEVQQALGSREVGCTGACHPSAHPPSALGGGGPT